MHRLLPTAFALLCLVLPAAPAHAQQVQRCIGADGRAVYTDRRCDDIGAVSRLPPASAGEAPRLFRGGCPRLLSQLVGEIGAAIQNRDVNRLASVYDWSGMSDATASRVLDRLEAMVERPLVDIAPVYGSSEPVPPVAATPSAAADAAQAGTAAAAPATDGPAAWMPSWGTGQTAGTDPAAPAADTDTGGTGAAEPSAPATPRPRPVGLRIEQTLAGSATPARTVFDLHRGYGCFWITL